MRASACTKHQHLPLRYKLEQVTKQGHLPWARRPQASFVAWGSPSCSAVTIKGESPIVPLCWGRPQQAREHACTPKAASASGWPHNGPAEASKVSNTSAVALSSYWQEGQEGQHRRRKRNAGFPLPCLSMHSHVYTQAHIATAMSGSVSNAKPKTLAHPRHLSPNLKAFVRPAQLQPLFPHLMSLSNTQTKRGPTMSREISLALSLGEMRIGHQLT